MISEKKTNNTQAEIEELSNGIVKKTKRFPSGAVEMETYSRNKKLHREDGPAIIWYTSDGDVDGEDYLINGKLHREDGPAVITYDGLGNPRVEEYYINNRLHREDGPAKNWYGSGMHTAEYYLNGRNMTEAEWLNALKTKTITTTSKEELESQAKKMGTEIREVEPGVFYFIIKDGKKLFKYVYIETTNENEILSFKQYLYIRD